MKLVIGSKNFSSWSMRPWILMRHFDIPFEEVLIELNRIDTAANIRKYSSAGLVPILIDDNLIIGESLAIIEYLHEKFPERNLYPTDQAARAKARSVANEMHAGFSTLRGHLPFNAKARFKKFDFSPAMADIRRIQTLWTECLEQSGGPFLFGQFSVADAMYAPVVGRFETYGVPTTGLVARYAETIRGLPAFQAWYAEIPENNRKS